MSKNASVQVPAEPGIDLSVRPPTYFGPLPLAAHLLARVTGHRRREFLRDRMTDGDVDLPAELLSSSLDNDLRKAIGRIHPAFMGGEYLPPLRGNETEIARISLASVTADQISVRARRLKDRTGYRIVDEYPDDEIVYLCRPAGSKLPLTLAELVGLLDGAAEDGGVVLSLIANNIRCGANPQSLRGFVTVSSEFYPQLGAYYAARIATWFEENLPQEADVSD